MPNQFQKKKKSNREGAVSSNSIVPHFRSNALAAARLKSLPEEIKRLVRHKYLRQNLKKYWQNIPSNLNVIDEGCKKQGRGLITCDLTKEEKSANGVFSKDLCRQILNWAKKSLLEICLQRRKNENFTQPPLGFRGKVDFKAVYEKHWEIGNAVKFPGLPFEVFSECLCHCQYIWILNVLPPHHSNQMSQKSQVSGVVVAI